MVKVGVTPSVQQVDDMYRAIADCFSLPYPGAAIRSIDKGYVTLTWLIDTNTFTKLVERAHSNPNSFRECEIVSVKVSGGYIFREFCSIQGRDEPLLVHPQKLMIKVGVSPSFQQLIDMIRAIADRFPLPYPGAAIRSIDKGCVTLTSFIDTNTFTKLVEMAHSNPNSFRECEIVLAKVSCGYIFREHCSIQGQDEPVLVCSFD